MSSLSERLVKTGSIKTASVLSKSSFFNEKDVIPTGLPILNIAFSGEVDGGLTPGITVFAGDSKTFKTLLALYSLKAFLDKHPDGVCLFYDCEFGVTPEYLESNGIDSDRVIHIPVEHIEQMKFDIVKKLEEIKREDNVFIMVDSLGVMASKKEIDDAMDEKSVADMTRAKAMKSLFRIITPHITMKDIPFVAIAHKYETQEMYSKDVVSGGKGIMYAANTVIIISKSQEKEGKELVGYTFNLNIDKSRYVREKSKLPFKVFYEKGIDKYSGIFDLAVEAGFIIKPSKGWYQICNVDTGEVNETKKREAEILKNVDYWEKTVLPHPKFKQFVEDKYKLKTVMTNEQAFENDEEDTEQG